MESSAFLSLFKPALEIISYGIILFVGWLFRLVTMNSDSIKKNSKELSEYKVHVASTYAKSDDLEKRLEKIESTILREMQARFDNMEKLINATKNK